MRRSDWAAEYIEKLDRGETVIFRPRGNSMHGLIEDGELVTCEPVGERRLAIGDIVLCKVDDRQYLHLIKAICGPNFQIGNNRGGINGWISRDGIYGCVTNVAGRAMPMTPSKGE